MPSKYKTKEDLPKARNPNLEFREVGSHTVAAIAWRWGRHSSSLHAGPCLLQELRIVIKSGNYQLRPRHLHGGASA